MANLSWDEQMDISYGGIQQSVGMAHTAEELGMPKGSVSDAEIAEYREIFSLVDLDHGGTIDCEELETLMDLLGMNVTEDEVLEMIQEIDTTGTDEVSFSDFVRVVSKKHVPRVPSCCRLPNVFLLTIAFAFCSSFSQGRHGEIQQGRLAGLLFQV